ncbi:HK97 gp10 family phage protein [Microbulbifer salipaludis]|uniref:HK97 gp10 family phage protein n=1 Tax=Microbulbifer salipaludis TaxID=187980 RepID=A0ABS3E926_9GAMM|nr:HK97-gp10 family putative phage morphogenesis protein [Microbulbifer salipaludis]MBN8431810.1 HK97 gp10 family phage protein [Microbulbifer salipaludis]
MSDQIEIHGLAELDAALAKIGDAAVAQKALEDGLFDAAQVVQKAAKAKVSVESGRLRKSIRRYRGKEGKKKLAGVSKRDAVVYVGTKSTKRNPVFYARFVEYGTDQHAVELGKAAKRRGATSLVGKKGRFGKKVEVKAKAKPFLRPALDENRKPVIERFVSGLTKRIEKAWNGEVKKK